MEREASLMGRYCDGDALAFAELYERTAPPLLRYLIRLTRNRATAEDLLQVVFLKVHRARGAYVRGAAPRPWMYSIAKRTFLDEARRERRSRLELTSSGVVPEPPVAAEAEVGVDQRMFDELMRLPASQRQAIELTKLRGCSVVEAAAIAGVSPGALKVRAHRGYVALRRSLAV